MKIGFVAGFGPIIRDTDAAHAFWRDGLGIEFDEPAPGYFTNGDVEGEPAYAGSSRREMQRETPMATAHDVARYVLAKQES